MHKKSMDWKSEFRCIEINFIFKNYTRDNLTQGFMEKSQWDLKKIHF